MQENQKELQELGILCAEYCKKNQIQNITLFGGIKEGKAFFFIHEGPSCIDELTCPAIPFKA